MVLSDNLFLVYIGASYYAMYDIGGPLEFDADISNLQNPCAQPDFISCIFSSESFVRHFRYLCHLSELFNLRYRKIQVKFMKFVSKPYSNESYVV